MTNELGRSFRRWRGNRNQADAARILGIDQTTLCTWESGKKKPNKLRAKDIQERTGGAISEQMVLAAHVKKRR